MGLFMNRPEEPSEWAGLPAEPLEAESAAERLGASVDLGLIGPFGDSAGSVASIPVIPLSTEPGVDREDD